MILVFLLDSLIVVSNFVFGEKAEESCYFSIVGIRKYDIFGPKHLKRADDVSGIKPIKLLLNPYQNY